MPLLKKFILGTCCSLMVVGQPWASPAGYDALGAGFGARSAALNGPNPATGDAESLYWNPAGLAVEGMTQVLGTHFFWLDDITIDNIGLVLPAPWRGNWGLAASLLNVPDFNSTNDPSITSGLGHEGAVWLSGALQLSDTLDVGVNAKFIFSQWMEASSQAGALDLGLVYRPAWQPNIQIQSVVSNLGLATTLEQEADALPTTFNISTMLQLPEWDFVRPRIMGNVCMTRDSDLQLGLGTEVELFRNLTWRGGYRHFSDSDGQWSTGLGLAVHPFHLDYALRAIPDLDLVHFVSLRYIIAKNHGGPKLHVTVLAKKDKQNQFIQQFNIHNESTTPILRWTLSIFNQDNQLIRTWHKKGAPPETFIWDITDQDQNPITDDQGNWYELSVEDKAFRKDKTKGRLFSQQVALTPRLHLVPTTQTSAMATLSFAVKHISKDFNPKKYRIDFVSPKGKVLKQFTYILRPKNNLTQQLKLPKSAASYKITFIGQKNQKKETASSLIGLDAGLLIAKGNHVLNIPYPLTFKNHKQKVRRWQLTLQDRTTNKTYKKFKGRNKLPDHLAWHPGKHQILAKTNSDFQANLKITDKNGITWDRSYPIDVVTINDRSPNKKETHFEIDQILFGYNKYFIKQAMLNKLKATALLIRHYPVSQVVIKGHTDERGSDTYNLKLSKKRALAVKRYLAEKEGLQESLFTIKAFGFHKPLFKRKNETNRKKNRRVEIIIAFPTTKK